MISCETYKMHRMRECMKTTKEIEKNFGLTRRTLHNWIAEGLIESPQKDWRGWFIWSKEHEKKIAQILILKQKEKNCDTVLGQSNMKLKITNRRYIGSKQKMLDFIADVVEKNTENIDVVADVFGGTGSVADMFRKQGKKIIINDLLYSNYISFIVWFGNESVDYEKIIFLIAELNDLNAVHDNYVSKNFGNRYFSIENARKIGAIRQKIDSYKNLNDRERSFLLVSLLYATDKVANTVGHYDAYRKKMDTLNPIFLRVPELNRNQPNLIYQKDANELVRNFKADLVYIDTPYNSRQYGDAYHLLENIMEWKKPVVEGVAMKMVNRQHIKSSYSTSKAPQAFDDLISHINSKYILVSYNNMNQKGSGRSNAKISNEEIITSLEKRGKVNIFSTNFNVFTTGKTNINDHKELLYLCEVNVFNDAKR